MLHRIMILASLAIALAGTGSVFANPPSAEDFMPSYYGVKISPDGEYVATVRPHEGRNALYVYRFDEPPSEGFEPFSIIPSGPEVEMMSFVWASNDRLLIQAGFSFWNMRYWGQQFEYYTGSLVHAVDKDGGNPLSFNAFSFGSIDSYLPNEPEWIMLSGNRIAYKLNITNGEVDRLSAGRHVRGRIYADGNGRVRVMRRYTDDIFRINWRGANDNDWEEVYSETLSSNVDLSILALSGDGNEIYLTSHRDGRRAFYRVRPEHGAELETVYLDEQFDANGLGFDPRTGELRYVSILRDRYERVYFDTAFEALNARVEADIPDEDGIIVGSSFDGQRHVVRGDGVGRPGRYYLFDQRTDTYRAFASIYPSLDDTELSSVESFSFEARDGMAIASYLTRPAGAGDGPQPLIVMPHGGPFSRDDMEFGAMRQFISTRGYVVFQPNFRGSTGYGNAYQHAGRREWGRGMQEDITDGIRHLIDEGIADPDRICILGWSYGGYAALRGVSLTPDQYRCAVGINGVYDMVEVVNATYGEYGNVNSNANWSDMIARGGRSESMLRSLSPLHRVDRITAPVLLVASGHDPIARIAHSRDMAQALSNAGVSNETLFFDGGDHSLTFGSARPEIYRRIEAFLAEHLQ